MIGAYFDTSVVLKLVVEEPLSPAARAFVSEQKLAVPVTRLVEVEVANALHALRFRERITEEQLVAARRLVEALLREGRFRRVPLSLDKIAHETLDLAPPVTGQTGCRTLDLMHIAAARLLGARRFVSADKRQLSAAQLGGLEIVDLGQIG